jgi:hypothetical protein
MKTSSTIRLGGMAYLLAALSLILQQGYELIADGATSGAWTALHVIGYLGLSLGLIGFVALFLHAKDKIGSLGKWGFVLGFLGNSLNGGAAFLNAFIKPIAPQLTTASSPLFMGPAGLVILLAALLVTVGFILFAISFWRADIWRWAALLVILGSWFGLAAVFSTPLFDIGGIIFGLGNAWLGFGLWSSEKK